MEEEAAIEIPRSSGRHYIQKFVDQLPRPLITSTHPEDHMCLICRTEYETDVEEENEKDVAVQLPCGHILGSSCIVMWVSSKLSVMVSFSPSALLVQRLHNYGNADVIYPQCPSCTKPFLPPDLFGRVNDVRRYLFWLLRNQEGFEMACILLSQIDSFSSMQIPNNSAFELGRAWYSYYRLGITTDSTAGLLRYEARSRKRNRRIKYQASPEYREMFRSKIAH